MGGVYHVVCHECPFEGLYEDVSEAETASGTHREEHDHRVSKLELDRPPLRTQT